MPCALPLALREQIILLHQQHTPACNIAAQVQASITTVRRLIYAYKCGGAAGLQPAYKACGPKQPRCNRALLRAALWLKRLHPQWGAPFIHLCLIRRYKDQHAPSVRSMQRWMRKTGLNPPRRHLPSTHIGWALQPHNIWQVDAKERLVLQDGQCACYLTITDEHSGACLQALVFPPQPYRAGAGPGGAQRVMCGFQPVGPTRSHAGG